MTGEMDTIKESAGNDDDDEDMIEEELEETFSVECIGFSSHDINQKWIASGGMDTTLKIWDMNNGNLRCSCKHTTTVRRLK